MQNEAGSPPYGIVGANNPINVSQPGHGGTPIKAGDGLTSSSLADEIGTYSGHGYTTIPDSWGSSQGQPETP